MMGVRHIQEVGSAVTSVKKGQFVIGSFFMARFASRLAEPLWIVVGLVGEREVERAVADQHALGPEPAAGPLGPILAIQFAQQPVTTSDEHLLKLIIADWGVTDQQHFVMRRLRRDAGEKSAR